MIKKRFLTLLLGFISWTLLLAYVSVASRYCNRRQEQQMCSGVQVKVLDSAAYGFITSAMVKNWFTAANMQLEKRELAKINTLELERFIARRGFVRSVRVYTSLDGLLNVELTQRHPIARVNDANGYNFYITDDHYILPQQKYFVVYVPVITGNIDAPFDRDFVGSLDELGKNPEKKTAENYLFWCKLINFVKFVRGNEFWNSYIVQIHITGTDSERYGGPEIEIVPRVGDQIVLLGSVDDYEAKLGKLLTFYRNGLAYDGWSRYGYINLKYKDQIVCTR